MKTCVNCLKVYQFISPIEVFNGKFDNDCNKASLTKKNNFCNPKCSKEYIDQLNVAENEYWMARYPLEQLDMCQFCGHFTHPTEYCTNKHMEEYFIEHQKIDNKTGEHCLVAGDLLYIKAGKNITILKKEIVFSARMYKLNADLESRIPLVYFFYDEEVCKEILAEMIDNENINVLKSVVTEIDFVYEIQINKCKTECIYKARSITNPHKIFFPFDIRQENCWWPLEQKEEYRMNGKPIQDDFLHFFKYQDDEPPVLEEKTSEEKMEEGFADLTL